MMSMARVKGKRRRRLVSSIVIFGELSLPVLISRVPGCGCRRTPSDVEGEHAFVTSLETATDPVVTSCGHLFCWPHLYEVRTFPMPRLRRYIADLTVRLHLKWFETVRSNPTCPACKSTCSPSQVTPIYGRGRPEKDPRTKPIPSRPRPTPTPSSSAAGPSTAGTAPFGGPFRTPLRPFFPWNDLFTPQPFLNQRLGGTYTGGLGGGGTGSSMSFHAGIFPFPGLAMGWTVPLGGGGRGGGERRLEDMTPEEREREMETERVRQFTSRVFFMIAVLVFCEYGCHVGSPLLLWLISVLYQLNLPSLRLRHSGACHHSNAVPGMSGYRLPDKPSDPILRMVPTARLLYFSFSTHLQAWNL